MRSQPADVRCGRHRRTGARISVAGLLLTAACVSSATKVRSDRQAPDTRPNILIIITDDRPWLLYMTPTAPHAPYTPEPKYSR